MLNIYIKNQNKLFFHYNDEIHYYEFEDLEILLDEIVEEYQIINKIFWFIKAKEGISNKNIN